MSFVAGIVLADVVQPAAFSPVNDDISDLGALTATSAWLYNQVAATSPASWSRLRARFVDSTRSRAPLAAGVLGLVVVGTGLFLDGLFGLDCQGIDAGCDNTSWHASAHKMSRVRRPPLFS